MAESMFQIELQGADKLFKKFGAFAGLQMLRPPMSRGLLRLNRRMAIYPPKPAGSKYDRTLKYGQKWTIEVEDKGGVLTGKVGIKLAYAPWVGSAQFQTAVHARTGWMTDQRAIELEKDAIVQDFNNTIHNLLITG